MGSLPQLPNLAHNNLNSTVYSTIKHALLTGGFKPHAKIRIRELADQLGTSVTPVRDAILLLAKERALELRSPKDIRVPLLSRKQYLEIREIRLKLEGLAAEVAAEKASQAQLESLDALIHDNQQAIKDKDMIAANSLNQAFHFRLTEIADMPILRDIIDRLWLQSAPLIAMAYTDTYSDQTRISHHYDIMAALRERDGKKAKAAIRDDIIGGSQMILDLIDKLAAETE